MPIVPTLIKLALFALWGRSTYKMTVDMLEIRERRHGLLPPEESGSDDGKAGKDATHQPTRRPSDTK